MSSLVIEVGVPIPADKDVVGWPHAEMEVGQSFFIAGRGLQSVCNANQRFQKRLGWRFTARKVEGGIRVWRTE